MLNITDIKTVALDQLGVDLAPLERIVLDRISSTSPAISATTEHTTWTSIHVDADTAAATAKEVYKITVPRIMLFIFVGVFGCCIFCLGVLAELKFLFDRIGPSIIM